MIGVSQGTAAVIGLQHVRQTVPPTTGYLMHGQGCDNDCGFCAQARSSSQRSQMLSRVAWPQYSLRDTIAACNQAAGSGLLQRVCVQVVSCGQEDELLDVVRAVIGAVAVPVSVSISIRSADLARQLLAVGVDRIALPVDVAAADLYAQIKGGNLGLDLQVIERLRQEGWNIATHLIIGVGESEEQAVRMLAWCQDRGVHCGLFAFTPLPGTGLAGQAPPSVAYYRMVQLVRALLAVGHDVQQMEFEHGRLSSYGCDRQSIMKAVIQESPFETSGCPGCNRPFYNERPGGPWYNYPRPLTEAEVEAAVEQALTGRREEG